MTASLRRVLTPTRLPYAWLVLIVIVASNYFATLDASLMAATLPDLQEALDTSPSLILWVVAAYLLTSVALMLVVGRFSDMQGRKLWFVAGVFIFTLGTGLGATAQNVGQLIGFRVLAAVGGAMLLTAGIALLTSAFPPHQLGRAMGALGLGVSAGLASGPLIGGAIFDTLGWRAIFYLRVPLGVAIVILGIVWLRESQVVQDRQRFDVKGALVLMTALVSVFLALNRGLSWGLTSLPFLALLLFGFAMLAVFVPIERRAAHPLFDLTLLWNRMFTTPLVVNFFYFGGVSTAYYLMPFYLIQGREYSASLAGGLLSLFPILMMVVAPVAGFITDRLGSGLPLRLGLVVIVGGLFIVTRLTETTPIALVALTFVLLGAGSGLFEPPNQRDTMGNAPADRLSQASASMAISRQVGLYTGIAVGGGIFVNRLEHYSGASSTEGVVSAVQDSVFIMLSLALVALAIMLGPRRWRRNS
jgi:EmrB/QacA subfamily drug resistance transporter